MLWFNNSYIHWLNCSARVAVQSTNKYIQQQNNNNNINNIFFFPEQTSPELVDLQHIWSAASQRVHSLLGQVLGRRVEQVQLAGAQGVAGVVVAVRWKENLRGPVLIGTEQRVCRTESVSLFPRSTFTSNALE